MSAPVDVMRGIAAKFRRMSNDPVNVNAIDLDSAADAVAELIEAAELAITELKRQHAYNTGDEAGRVWKTLQANTAALARCKGEGA